METFKIQRQTMKYKCNLGSYNESLTVKHYNITFLVSSMNPTSKPMNRNKLYTCTIWRFHGSSDSYYGFLGHDTIFISTHRIWMQYVPHLQDYSVISQKTAIWIYTWTVAPADTKCNEIFLDNYLHCCRVELQLSQTISVSITTAGTS